MDVVIIVSFLIIFLFIFSVQYFNIYIYLHLLWCSSIYLFVTLIFFICFILELTDIGFAQGFDSNDIIPSFVRRKEVIIELAMLSTFYLIVSGIIFITPSFSADIP